MKIEIKKKEIESQSPVGAKETSSFAPKTDKNSPFAQQPSANAVSTSYDILIDGKIIDDYDELLNIFDKLTDNNEIYFAGEIINHNDFLDIFNWCTAADVVSIDDEIYEFDEQDLQEINLEPEEIAFVYGTPYPCRSCEERGSCPYVYRTVGMKCGKFYPNY